MVKHAKLSIPLNAAEIDDLRKSPIEQAQAVPWSFSEIQDKQTDALDPGTQQRMIDAAWAAYQLGAPLDALLTVRITAPDGADGGEGLGMVRNRVERLRKWMARHNLPVHYIWVREVSPDVGEHCHIAFHAPRSSHQSLLPFLERLLGEKRFAGRHSDAMDGEVARVESGTWQLSREIRDDQWVFPGHWLAAYLGKGEPSEGLYRGEARPNFRKSVRGHTYGGDRCNARYDTGQGVVRGNASRKGRFDISKALKRASG